jgi:hypothetical protein
LLSSASSRYVLAGVLLAPVVPDVPVAELELLDGVTFVRMNLMVSLALDVPEVPAVACSARWMQPVTVRLLLEL